MATYKKKLMASMEEKIKKHMSTKGFIEMLRKKISGSLLETAQRVLRK